MRSIAFLLVLALSSSAAVAQQQMPDAGQMAGQPLPAPDLAAGLVSVRVVRERMGNNIEKQPVTLRAADRTLQGTTDAQGRAVFGDVPAGTRVTVEAVVDGETLRSQEFAVPASGGIRIALIAGLQAAAARDKAARDEAAQQPARAGVVVFGGESRVIFEFQDDNLQVFYLLDILNNARTPIDIGEPMFIVLPEGAVAPGALDGSSSLAAVQGDRVRINGPFPPGTTQVQVGFRFPYSSDTATLTQRWPAAFEQLFVAAEKIGNLQLASPQFQQQQDANAGGAPFIMATGGRLNAGDPLTITLSGLPHRSTTVRDVGIAAGVLILALGLAAAFTGRSAATQPADDLLRRKEKLLSELVTIETQHDQGRMDEQKYVSRRQTLVTQLERVMAEIDDPPASQPRRGGPGGGQGVAA